MLQKKNLKKTEGCVAINKKKSFKYYKKFKKNTKVKIENQK